MTTTKTAYDKIEELYDENLEEFAEYAKGRAEIMENCENEDEATGIVIDYDPDGAWENLAWDAGCLRGIEMAKNLFSNNN